MQHVRQARRRFLLDAVDAQAAADALPQAGLHLKFPLPAFQKGLQSGVGRSKGDQLPVSPCTVGAAAREIFHRLQQICFSLGVFAVNQVYAGGKCRFQVLVVPKMLQPQPQQLHKTVSFRPLSVTTSPGRTFLPRWVQTAPLTETSPS
ncbi:hypothetical protein SDC9_74773 [bioreactor metagenome]|uniref:Uncharacterized protein n=1 Tax=bioreactor metagenome TaxID=1076179 RepID=A0A644YP28_9ZZZZ